MDIKQAASATRPYLRYCKPQEDAREGTSIEHLTEMLDKIESGEVTGENAHLWLGWVQGVACSHVGGPSLAELEMHTGKLYAIAKG